MSNLEKGALSPHHLALVEYYYQDCRSEGGGRDLEAMFTKLLGREVKPNEIDVGGPDKYVPSKDRIAALFAELEEKSGYSIDTFFYIDNKLSSLEESSVLDDLVEQAAAVNVGNEAVSEELEAVIVSWLKANAETLRPAIATALKNLPPLIPADELSLLLYVDVKDSGKITLTCRNQKDGSAHEFEIGQMPLPTDEVSGQTAVAVKDTLEN